MSLLRGFAAFWYDFVVGDDWKISCAVVVALAAGAGIAAAAATDADWIAPLIGAALAAAFAVSLAIDVRRR
ncbi:MAG: hypothetical protein ACRDM1_02105 [Gaiellaceae bacterium]